MIISKGSGTTRKTNSSTAHGGGISGIAGNYGLSKLGRESTKMAFNGSIISNYTYNPNVTQLIGHINEYLSNSQFKQYPNKGYGVEMAKEIAKDLQARGASVTAVKGKAMLKNDDGYLVSLSLGSKDLKWKAKESNSYKSVLKETKKDDWINAMNDQKKYYNKKKS